jgi:hypothetical protein
MPHSPLKFSRRFGGICRLHLQGRRIRQAINQREHRWQAKPAYLNLPSWRWRRYVAPKLQMLTFNDLHGVIYQKTVLFIGSAASILKLSVSWSVERPLVFLYVVLYSSAVLLPHRSISCRVITFNFTKNTTVTVAYVNTLHFDIHHDQA